MLRLVFITAAEMLRAVFITAAEMLMIVYTACEMFGFVPVSNVIVLGSISELRRPRRGVLTFCVRFVAALVVDTKVGSVFVVTVATTLVVLASIIMISIAPGKPRLGPMFVFRPLVLSLTDTVAFYIVIFH